MVSNRLSQLLILFFLYSLTLLKSINDVGNWCMFLFYRPILKIFNISANYFLSSANLIINIRLQYYFRILSKDHKKRLLEKLFGNSIYRIRFTHRIKMKGWHPKFHQLLGLCNSPFNSNLSHLFPATAFFHFTG
ncbi:hypothetical protein SAMN06265219_101259 [Gracilimonas mengyeensis]|uniref:Uncharacterized protein n=1 Tax=Gracilimonas mengyeensis TaxID=1302730 RepID=A0A521AN42_9BACT|nr:hypothetical protein SAMN06265219_101259 [Gracilimonas mengyeensis]